MRIEDFNPELDAEPKPDEIEEKAEDKTVNKCETLPHPDKIFPLPETPEVPPPKAK